MRSTTLRSSAVFEVAQLRRRQLVVEDDDVDVAPRRTPRRASSTLPLPRNVAGSGFGRSCSTRSTTSRAGGGGQAGQLVERMFGIEVPGGAVEETDERRALPGLVARPIGKTRCASLDAILARGPTPPRRRARSAGRAVDDLDDRRRRAAGRRPAVEQQSMRRRASRATSRRHRRRLARTVGARRGDAAAECRRQRARDRVRGHADADACPRRRQRARDIAAAPPARRSSAVPARTPRRAASSQRTEAIRACARLRRVGGDRAAIGRRRVAPLQREQPLDRRVAAADRRPGHRACRSGRRRRRPRRSTIRGRRSTMRAVLGRGNSTTTRRIDLRELHRVSYRSPPAPAPSVSSQRRQSTISRDTATASASSASDVEQEDGADAGRAEEPATIGLSARPASDAVVEQAEARAARARAASRCSRRCRPRSSRRRWRRRRSACATNSQPSCRGARTIQRAPTAPTPRCRGSPRRPASAAAAARTDWLPTAPAPAAIEKITPGDRAGRVRRLPSSRDEQRQHRAEAAIDELQPEDRPPSAG